jgi:hypothetical protein
MLTFLEVVRKNSQLTFFNFLAIFYAFNYHTLSYSFFTINVKPSLTDMLVKPIMVVTFSSSYFLSTFMGSMGSLSSSTHQALYIIQVWSSI